MIALIHGAFLNSTWLVIKWQHVQIVVRCAGTLTCPTWKAQGFLHRTIHHTPAPYVLGFLYPEANVIDFTWNKLQSGLKADPNMSCKRSRLTTDLESDYPHKGSTRGDVTISDVSEVRSKLHQLLLITITHLSISVPFHPLQETGGLGWSVQNSASFWLSDFHY